MGVTEQDMEGLPCCGGDRAGYGRSTLLWGRLSSVWKVYLVMGATEQGMEGLPCYGGD